MVDPSEIAGRGGALPDRAVIEAVAGIVSEVRERGDRALIECTERFDGVRLDDVRAETGAAVGVDRHVLGALEAMAGRLRDLHAHQLPSAWSEHHDGLRLGEVVRPLPSVGCYVPGGRAAYPSSVLMTVVPAKVAGVPRVVLCSPPGPDGRVAGTIAAAAEIAGADEVYAVGGAQAIAALAVGTETIEPVAKIVGPGNVWVTEAKRQVAGIVGIDGLAGPTELVIVADGTADPATLAVDLVAQAEHDPEARFVLVCFDGSLLDAVGRALWEEVRSSPRRAIVEEAVAGSAAVVVEDEAEAAEVVEAVAPEHLQILTADPDAFLDRVRSFGAAFLGPDTPVTFGDYGVGSNHVLPTMGTARFASGLRAADFVTVRSVVAASPEAVRRLGPEVELVARSEGLPGHARASEVRR